MPITEQQARADIDSWTPPAPKDAPGHPMEQDPTAKPDPIQAAKAPAPAVITPSFLDGVIASADRYASMLGVHTRQVRDLAAGALTGAVNTADAVKSGIESIPPPASGTGEPIGPDLFHPAYDHARQAVLNFRDAIAVKDPSIPDHLIQGAGQLAPSFMMFSRVLGSIGNLAKLTAGGEGAATITSKIVSKIGDVAKVATADAATNATAVAPHDPRLSDAVSLLQHSEGQFGDLLRKLPGGVTSYIDYLADHGNETEAEGRWKNVVDGLGAGAVLGGMLGTAGSIFKQGWNTLHFMADNNMGSMSSMIPANQEGKIGWHGTPHEPQGTTFDDSKIGTGEGAQIYGYGHYIAENPETGEYYANMLQRNGGASAAQRLAKQTMLTEGSGPDAYKKLTAMADNASHPNDKAHYMKAASLIKSGNVDAGKGNLLKVDIPDEDVAKYLDHDKPMSEQTDVLNKIPKADRDALQAELENSDSESDFKLEDLKGGGFRKLLEKTIGEGNIKTPDMMDQNIPRQAAQYLNEHGIPGIKFFDEQSRAPRVLNKNGEPIRPSYNEKQAHDLVLKYGSVDKALAFAERSQWGHPDAFYQDKEKLATLQKLKDEGATVDKTGTRNFVVFEGKRARILEKNGKPVEEK